MVEVRFLTEAHHSYLQYDNIVRDKILRPCVAKVVSREAVSLLVLSPGTKAKKISNSPLLL